MYTAKCRPSYRGCCAAARDETGPADILSLHAHFQAPIPTTITTPVEEQFLVGKKRRPLVIVNILSHRTKTRETPHVPTVFSVVRF